MCLISIFQNVIVPSSPEGQGHQGSPSSPEGQVRQGLPSIPEGQVHVKDRL